MSIERPNFDNITEDDLRHLLDNQKPEGQRLDYKQALYVDGLETMKDLSAFANTNGGHLIIGIAESGGIPTAMDGVVVADPDAEIRRIEQRMESGVEPIIQGIRIKNIVLANGKHCFVIRVPKSWRPPHRVVAQGKNRFYMRNSSAVYEPDVEGLRMLFTAGVEITQRVRQFRQERIELISHGNATRPLQGNGRVVLHVVPFASVSSDIQIDLDQAHKLQEKLRPMGTILGMTPRFNFDGFINERGGEENFGYTQVFRNGIIEATKASIIHRDSHHPEPWVTASELEEYLVQALPSYMAALHDLQVPPPFAVALTLEGVKGTAYWVGNNTNGSASPRIGNDPLFLPEGIINAYGTDIDYQQALRPAFDALWNSAGRSRDQWFTGPSGAWQRPRQ